MNKNQNSDDKNSKNLQWDLTLLYQSKDDPQIEKDLKIYEEKRRAFAEKYKDRTDYLLDEDQLLAALTEYENLIDELNGGRPLIYYHYLTSIEAQNHQAHAELNRVTTKLTKAHNHLTFFPIKLGQIDHALQTKFLKAEKLKRYRFLLQQRFKLAKYDLKDSQEKILNLTDHTSYQMWVEGVEKSLNQKTVDFHGVDLPLSAAAQKIPELPDKERQDLHQKLLEKTGEVEEFAESEINAIVNYKQMDDELRGHNKPYQATMLNSDNDQETILNLVDLVTKNFDLAHQFYELKAKLLKKKQLSYADRSAKLDSFSTKYEFAEAKKIVNQTFANLDPQFEKILQKMLKNKQIDIYPRQGKVSGAFCSSSTNNPTFVLLNHTDDFNSVTTFAHEMGHAIHSELSKQQPVIYQGYSTSTAETASTFFEQFVFDRLITDFDEKQKIVALHNKIQDDINTIFRQVALFNFELELHEAIKTSGFLSAQEIGHLLNKHTAAYLGPLFELTDLDGRFFILWSHIRYYFYTYTYAYGHLISKALVKKTKDKPEFVQKVKQFLSAGGSDTPKNIFAGIGIDISQPEFFKAGLEEIRGDVEKLRGLVG